MVRYISLLLLIGLTFGSHFLPAQTITNVQARQEGLEIIITYDMTGELQGTDGIKVGYSTDGGRNYKPISGADGDVGKNVKPGTSREISFLVNDALAGKNAKFKVGTISEFPPPGMVFVAGGTFQMGSYSGGDDENPVHTVTVSSFFMDKTEVTQAEYRKVMGENPSIFSGCDDCPVENVSWHDANAYAQKVGKRLPTEAEWEYAARGGNKSKGYEYSGGNSLDIVGWNDSGCKDCGSKTHPVAQKQPNELGLYDMSGNVWEWCTDWYDEGYYSGSPQNDPQGPHSGKYRVLRGGPYTLFSGRNCRSAARYMGKDYWYVNRGRSRYYGFRLVLSLDL
jgi:formylglycine-generating enzyme required for sulfatase activity